MSATEARGVLLGQLASEGVKTFTEVNLIQMKLAVLEDIED